MDGIPVKISKIAFWYIAATITYLCHESCPLEAFPSSGKVARVITLFKDGNAS